METRKTGILRALTALLLAVLLAAAVSGAVADGAVAKIGDVGYETLDAAVAAAKDGDTINVLDDCTTEGLNLSKNIVIAGDETNGKTPTITFTKYGIALWGKALTFENCDVVMNNIGSTPYTAEWNWVTICASKDASLTLNNATMTMDGANAGNKHAIYFCSNNKLNLNGSTLTIKNYQQDALEWDGGDGGYNVNIVNSTFISDHNRSGFTGTFYATIDNSEVEVINSRGNGSNGTYYTIKNQSNVLFDGNTNWGISAWRIDMTDHSTLKAVNNGYSGIWTRVLNVDSTCTLDVEGNGAKATGFTNNAGIFFQGNGTYKSVVEAGANVTIKNNAGSGIYTGQGVCNLTLNSGVITNNGTGTVNANNGKGATYGGGVYNVGTMVLGNGVVIYNNHADTAGDDIYNTKKIIFDPVGSGWMLDGAPDCNGEIDPIDGWYDDSEGTRWEAHSVANRHIELYPDVTDSPLALKAAHGILVDPAYPKPGTAGDNDLDKVADERLDENYQANVTLVMPSYAEPLETDVVFVLDKSTSATVEAEALKMLSDLQGQLTKINTNQQIKTKINVGVVIFNKVANPTDFMDLETQYSEIESAIRQEISGGTNTHAGLISGINMLSSGRASADRKYLIFVSDGITYMYNESPTAIALEMSEHNWFAGPDNWKVKYGNTDAPASWTTYFQTIAGQIAADGNTYELPYDQCGKGNSDVYIPYAERANHAMSIDKALYNTYVTYKAVPASYHKYAVLAESASLPDHPWAKSFMNFLAGGNKVDFNAIKNDLCYLYGAGSEVTDVIGYGDTYDKNGEPITDDYAFDFVNDPKALVLEYSRVNEQGQFEKIGYDLNDQKVDADGNTTYYFGRGGAENGEEYAFELTYYPKGIAGVESNQVEHFTLKFNCNIKLGEQVKLTYKVELEEQYRETEPGLFTELHTNKNAYIDPVDSEGNDGERQFFPDPVTSYENISVIKKWDGENDSAVRPETIGIVLSETRGDGSVKTTDAQLTDPWIGIFTNVRKDRTLSEVPITLDASQGSYSTTIVGESQEYVITNTYATPVPTATPEPTATPKPEKTPEPAHDEMDLTVRKVWVGDNPADRPKEIKVKVGVNNDPEYVGLYFTLNEANGWQVTDGGVWVRDYYVEELNTPAGYISTVEREGNTFIITNTYVPATGDDSHLELWIALACLGIGGLLLMMVRRRRNA